MTAIDDAVAQRSLKSGWGELWSKEDWWAIWIGLAVVIASSVLFWNGGTLRWLAVLPPRWTVFSQVVDDVSANWLRYLGLFAFWLAAGAAGPR